jgi:hypothetical protein
VIAVIAGRAAGRESAPGSYMQGKVGRVDKVQRAASPRFSSGYVWSKALPLPRSVNSRRCAPAVTVPPLKPAGPARLLGSTRPAKAAPDWHAQAGIVGLAARRRPDSRIGYGMYLSFFTLWICRCGSVGFPGLPAGLSWSLSGGTKMPTCSTLSSHLSLLFSRLFQREGLAGLTRGRGEIWRPGQCPRIPASGAPGWGRSTDPISQRAGWPY